MKWGELKCCPLLVVKQEALVYQKRLTHDSFIVQFIPRWLDYCTQRGERRGSELETDRKERQGE